MKKFFQKTIIATLTCLMLTFSFGSKPVDAISAQTLADAQEVAARATEISENLMHLQILKALNIGGITKGSCIFRCVTGVAKLGFSILKLAGVFGTQKSQAQLLLEHFDDRLDAVDGKLNEIDKKLADVESSLTEQLRAIGGDVNEIAINQYKANISKVADIAQSINKDINGFETLIASNLVEWYDLSNYPDYNRDINITYVTDTTNGATKTVFIPKSLVNEVLKTSDAWVADNKDALVKNIYKKAINLALDDTTNSYSTTYDDFKEYSKVMLKGTAYDGKDFTGLDHQVENEQKEYDKILDSFAEAANDALRYECMKKIAQSKTSAANSYANDLVGIFNSYCEYLIAGDDGHSSPLKSQYDIYSRRFAFQGELKCTIEYDGNGDGKLEKEETNLAALAREYYFEELNRLGSYVAEMAKASGSYTDNEIYNSISLPWSRAEAALNGQYNDFYNKDNYGKEIDNYCYFTKSVLTHELENLEFKMHGSYEDYYKKILFVTKHKVVSMDREIVSDWKFSVDNSCLASNNDLAKIYAYCVSNNVFNEKFNFYDFLNKYNVCLGKSSYNDISPLIITQFNGGNDLGSGDRVTVLAYPLDPTTDGKYYEGNKNYKQVYVYNYYQDCITGSSPDMVFRRKALANTFNVLTGETIIDKNVGTAAMSYIFHKDQDDMAMISDAEYTPVSLLAESSDKIIKYNCDLARKWTRFDKSKVSSDDYIYDCYMDYSKKYGVIIENDLSVYKANGKMSKTNSINLLANNYIKNVSFTNSTPIANSSIINANDVSKYESVVNSQKTKFENLLLTLYPDKASEIEKLKKNNQYTIMFNNDKYVNLDINTYQAMLSKLITFLSEATIDEMVGKYKEMHSEIIKTLDTLNAENNDSGIVLSDANYNKLITSLLNYYLIKDEFSICELESEFINTTPTTKDKYLIYCKENGLIYVWDENKYVKGNSITKDKVAYVDETKLPNVVVPNKVLEFDNLSQSDLETCHGEYIYNKSNSTYYKWKEAVIPEHNGTYEKLTNIKKVDSVPTAKDTDYIYCGGKYYQWMIDSKVQYVEITNVPSTADENTYVGEIAKINGSYYQWKEIKYVAITKVNSITDISDHSDYYVECNSNCYKLSPVTTYSYEEVTNVQPATDKNNFAGVVAIIDGDYYQWYDNQYVKIATVNSLPTMGNNYVVCNSKCYKLTASGKYVEVKDADGISKVKEVTTMDNSKYDEELIVYNNEFFRWKESAPSSNVATGQYEEITGTVKKVKELERKADVEVNTDEILVYPSINSKNIKITYEAKPIIAFELYFDKDIEKLADVDGANLQYNVIPYFDITPMLSWVDDGGAQHNLEIPDEVIQNSGLSTIPVKIPVIEMTNSGDTNALVYHFDSIEQTSCPIDQYSPVIKTNVDGSKYVVVYANSFSPFMVKNTFVRTDSGKKNKFPVTGIE